MQPFRLHVFVCDQQKPEGLPSCSTRGSGRTLEALRREVAVAGLADEVQITASGSLGLCERGPNMVVYPEGTWYSGVTPDDVPEIVRSHFKEGRPVERLVNTDPAAVKDEIRGNRDRYLASLRAKEASGALPDELDQMIRAFRESRIVLTALELDVFSAAGGGATREEVAARIGTDARATGMLLDAVAALGLLTKEDGRYATTAVSGRFLAEGGANDARAALLHSSSLWARWSHLTECVKAGTSVTYREMAERDDSWTMPFIAAMHRNASERAPLVVSAVRAGAGGGIRRMLDVGGGSGAYAIAFAKADPELVAEVLDLATVLPITTEHIRAAGLEGRVTTREGDLRRDALGSGHDLVFVSAICHMLGEEENRDLLRRCADALVPGGRIVIQDFLLEPDRTAPKSAALFSINMLVGTERGSSYTEEEYASWLAGAGFGGIRRVRLPGPSGLMIATKG